MTKVIDTKKAPAAIGPYVQAVDLGSLVITSGQLPVDPVSGEFPQSIADQTRRSLDNVKAIIEEAGLSVSNIVKTTVFMKDLKEFAEMNSVYQDFFNEHKASFPARSCIEVARIPKDAKIEIEVIAVRK
ncbi:2-iminobutanoate/2-iminopropanoate deaminase [Commensalibacter sp. Nvir]|uniref:RidA family protein n=1 Tax=Commensalibacter sp. Nvir TaxID=3069817 RepID=UPI002D5F9DDC|nr:2-iminobutanoate/2-iminopropanoate deaminase [Commensalibacter sp. Nvir]